MQARSTPEGAGNGSASGTSTQEVVTSSARQLVLPGMSYPANDAPPAREQFLEGARGVVRAIDAVIAGKVRP